MRELTVDEFNKEFGVNTWGTPKYTMVTKEDIGTYVCQKREAYLIPYFCKWLQTNKLEDMNPPINAGYGPIIKIIEG